MSYFSLSSFNRLEVKWAGHLIGDRLIPKTVHCNPFYELIVITDGPIFLQVDNEQMTLLTGECLLLSPWQEHQGWKKCTPESGFIWVQFSTEPSLVFHHQVEDLTGKIQFAQSEHNDLRTSEAQDTPIFIPRRLKTSRRYELLSLFEQLVAAIAEPRGYFRLRVNILFWSILEILAYELIRIHHLDPSISASFKVYRNVINFLEVAYMTDVSKQILEPMINRKYEYICNVFKKHSGLTISEYILQLRIQRAKVLLSKSNHSVMQIAQEVGFQDPYYFSRQFKKMTGLTPSQFRITDRT